MGLFHSKSASEVINDCPVIGVYDQKNRTEEYTEIVPSYVKWIDTAGGRVVPIPFYVSKKESESLISALNGLLFPGGSGQLPDQAKYLYQLALKINQQGQYFPVWGTCLGFEWLLECNFGQLDHGFDSVNISIPASLTFEGKENSRIFKNASPGIIHILSTQPVCFNHHSKGITPENFYSTVSLRTFFHALCISQDRKGQSFVSMIESQQFPIYGTQWHPEKNAYEFGRYPDGKSYEQISHSADARNVSQYLANFFVDECRKSNHHFRSEPEEDIALIYNYLPTKTGPEFEQTYYFNSR